MFFIFSLPHVLKMALLTDRSDVQVIYPHVLWIGVGVLNMSAQKFMPVSSEY